MTDEITTWSGWIEGPRWAKAGIAVRKAAAEHGLALVSYQEDKSLFRTTAFYTLRGSRRNIQAFNARLEHAVEEWNW